MITVVIHGLFVFRVITEAAVVPDFAFELFTAVLLFGYLALAEWPLRSFAKRLAEVMTTWTVISLPPKLALRFLTPCQPACLLKVT